MTPSPVMIYIDCNDSGQWGNFILTITFHCIAHHYRNMNCNGPVTKRECSGHFITGFPHIRATYLAGKKGISIFGWQ